MKKFFIALAMISSLSTFALDSREEYYFQVDLAAMTTKEKVAIAGANVFSMVISCPGGAALTALSAILDTIPVGTVLSDMVLDISDSEVYGDYNDHNETAAGAILGGAVSLVYDVIATPIDYADGRIEDGDYDKAFKALRETYYSTGATARAAFGEKGYCVDQFERLGFILGLKE